MIHDLFHFNVNPVDLAIRGMAVYLFVLILIRMSGKRQLGQMGATEFVAILLLSNAVQNSMNGGDNSLVGGLLLATVLIATNWLINLLTFKSKRFSRVFEGTPRLVVHRGTIIKPALAKERLTHGELSVLLRKQGIHHLSEVKNAILEADGTLTITKTDDGLNTTAR